VRQRLRKTWTTLAAVALAVALLPVTGASAGHGFLTPEAPYITLDPGVPAGSAVKAIITVGESPYGDLFEGIPDGIGVTDGAIADSIDVYINHEQTTIPFFGTADFQDASVTKLTLSTLAGHEGEVLASEIVISAADGYKRFCSASIGTVAEGFDVPVFLTGEEANDITSVPAGAPYGADPSLAPDRQAGYAVVLNTETGESAPVPGMGRLNHENTIALPGYNQLALVTTDDTFDGPSAQLYLYVVEDQEKLFADQGRLFAFQVTHDSDGKVDRHDPFNGANDYVDLQPGDDFKGRFIPVPKAIAKGTTGVPPQQALEDWSNDNNVFQFVRLEDIAYDKNDPNVVYIADTGRSRVVPDAATGRLTRGPGGTVGLTDNGRIFKMVFDEFNPRKVVSFSVLADGDTTGAAFVPFVSPDNIDTSVNSLMVQEDADNAKIWRYDLAGGTWEVVATVNDPDGESSGIVDASQWYGAGAWLLDVQAHGTFIDQQQVGPTLLKREDGQLMLLEIPGS
jgi:hypothetical protein